MTDSVQRQLSDAALEALTPSGARELAAAEIMVKASTLMWRAFEQSGLSQRALADALGVTEGRVSQILHGDGNVRLSTLARYLRATGYLAKLEAVPSDPSVPPLRTREPRRVGRQRRADLHDVWVTQVEHAGQTQLKITALPSGVPLDAVEKSTNNHVGSTSAQLNWTPLQRREIGTT